MSVTFVTYDGHRYFDGLTPNQACRRASPIVTFLRK